MARVGVHRRHRRRQRLAGKTPRAIRHRGGGADRLRHVRRRAARRRGGRARGPSDARRPARRARARQGAAGDLRSRGHGGGGANAAALAADGGSLVTQNGGLDFEAVGMFENPPAYRPTQSGLQRVTPDGTVTYLTPDTLRAPNDLVVAPDGTVFFTDP